MQRKVLAAVDGSHHSMAALRYLGSTFGSVDSFHIVLLNMISAPPPVLLQEARTKGEALAKLKMLRGRMRVRAEEVLDRSQEELEKAGIPTERIERTISEARGGTAKSIIFEAQNNLYDALVMGRRGMGRFQEMFVGSVSQKTVAEAQTVPVWIVDGDALGDKVLVALDGSEDSFKAIDHVGFIVSRHPEIEVILCHVSSSLARACPLEMDDELKRLEEEMLKAEEDRCMSTFFNQARKMLLEHGVADDQITIHFRTKGLETARAILADARETKAGTVVIGRRGVSRTRDVLLGSITSRVVQGASDLAVWVVV